MVSGYIICAGKQSRFGLNIPKALMKIGDKTILQRNIEIMSKYADKVYIVVSTENKDYFKDYENILVIESGKGSGDAILKALSISDSGDKCFIQWGDSLIKDYTLYENMINNYRGTTLIPCIIEDKPYVQLSQINDYVQVSFSKYGDKTEKGFHDLSIFLCNSKELLFYLNIFYKAYYFNHEYDHIHKEFEFLELFNDQFIKASILDVTHLNVRSYSFNTVEEYNKILGEK